MLEAIARAIADLHQNRSWAACRKSDINQAAKRIRAKSVGPTSQLLSSQKRSEQISKCSIGENVPILGRFRKGRTVGDGCFFV